MTKTTSKPSVLVTGATGFLGRAIVAELQRQKIPVHTTGRRRLLDQSLPNYQRCDLTDNRRLPLLLQGATHCIHAAGLAHIFDKRQQSAQDFQKMNVEVSRQLAVAAANLQFVKFVNVSSVSVYGPSYNNIGFRETRLRDESTPALPTTPYGRSKLQAEQFLQEISQDIGLPTISLRLATLYGPGDPGNVLKLIRAIDRGRYLKIGDGQNLKSLLHVEDAARACVTAALCDAANGATCSVYNVSSEPETMADIVATISRQLQRTPPRWSVPPSIPRTTLGMLGVLPGLRGRCLNWQSTLKKLQADDAYDGSRFIRNFGLPPWIALEEGIAGVVQWYKESTEVCSAA